MQEIDKLLAAQRAFFRSGATLSLTFREAMLRKLYGALVKYEASIACALRADLGKSVYESYMCEIGLARSEIRYQLRHLRRFAARKPVRTPLSQLPARSVTMPSQRAIRRSSSRAPMRRNRAHCWRGCSAKRSRRSMLPS